MYIEDIREAMQRTVDGDLEATAILAGLPHEDLLAAARGNARFVVTSSAVQRVLRALREDGSLFPVAHDWANFVSLGEFPESPPASPPRIEVDIEFDPAYQEEIASVVAPLTWWGDTITDLITEDDLDRMAASLPE
jgi:hypothetical protein